MPQKAPKYDYEAYVEGLMYQSNIEQAVREIEELTGRELYYMPSYTNAPLYVVNRPVNHSMHGAICNYSINPVDVMKDTLIDGSSYYKIEDWEHIRREDYMRRVEVDYTNEVIYALICYPINDGKGYYWESYSLLTSTGSTLYTQYKITVRDDEKTQDSLVVDFETILPYMPYVACTWNNGIGIIDTVRTALIRLEASARVIAIENIERKGMSLYITGVDDISKIKNAPRRFGRNTHILPTGASFQSPPSDAAGINLMTQEQIDLWDGIERSTGVVSTEKIAALSGISRTIAEHPLIILCEDIRQSFNEFLQKIYVTISFQGAPEPEVVYKSLEVKPPFETPEAELNVLDRALEKGTITQDEWNYRVRELLSLGNLA